MDIFKNKLDNLNNQENYIEIILNNNSIIIDDDIFIKIKEIKNITFDEFLNIYKTDIENLKEYINSNNFNIYKFMYLNNNIKKYIISIFNSKKAIQFLFINTEYIIYKDDNDDELYDFNDKSNIFW